MSKLNILKGGFDFAELPEEIQGVIVNIIGHKDEALRKAIAKRSELVKMCKTIFPKLKDLPLKNPNQSITARNINVTEIAGKFLYDHQIILNTEDFPEKLDELIGKDSLSSFLERFGEDYRDELWQLEEDDEDLALQLKLEMERSEFFKDITQYLRKNINDIIDQYKEEQTIIDTKELELMKIDEKYRYLFFRNLRSPKVKTVVKPSEKSPKTAAKSPKTKSSLSPRSRSPDPRKRGGYSNLVSKVKKMSIK